MGRVWVGLLVAVAALAPGWAAACVCDKEVSFSNIAAVSETIVQAVVIGRGPVAHDGVPLSVVLQVSAAFKGATKGEEFVLWDGSKAECGPRLVDFVVKSEWILALDEPGPTVSVTSDKRRHFVLPDCAERTLQVRKGMVGGRLDSLERREMPLEEFVRTFKRTWEQ